MEDFTPETEPSGSLVPPPRVPPTALALASPSPAPMRREENEIEFGNFARVLNATLDMVDRVADTVAEALQLR